MAGLGHLLVTSVAMLGTQPRSFLAGTRCICPLVQLEQELGPGPVVLDQEPSRRLVGRIVRHARFQESIVVPLVVRKRQFAASPEPDQLTDGILPQLEITDRGAFIRRVEPGQFLQQLHVQHHVLQRLLRCAGVTQMLGKESMAPGKITHLPVLTRLQCIQVRSNLK